MRCYENTGAIGPAYFTWIKYVPKSERAKLNANLAKKPLGRIQVLQNGSVSTFMKKVLKIENNG